MGHHGYQGQAMYLTTVAQRCAAAAAIVPPSRLVQGSASSRSNARSMAATAAAGLWNSRGSVANAAVHHG